MCKISLYRADGSKTIGMGHLYRAFFISKLLLKRYGIKLVLVVKYSPEADFFIKQRKMEHVFIDGLSSIDNEIKNIKDIIHEKKPLLFFSDVLKDNLNLNYTMTIRECKVPLISITDDSNHSVIDADLIINGNPNQLGQKYSNNYGKYLLGPKYFVMDPDYANMKLTMLRAPVENILLTFGGSDHNNILFSVIDAFKHSSQPYSITIITSKNTGYLEELSKYILNPSKHQYKLLVDVNELTSFWRSFDVAITAGGNTLFERIASRLPGATICQLPRQIEIADKFESMGVNKNFGYFSQISQDSLIRDINSFLSDRMFHLQQFELSAKIVDGNGLKRIMDEINILVKENYGILF